MARAKRQHDVDVYDLVDWALTEHRKRMAAIRAQGREPNTLEEMETIWALGGEILDRSRAIREHHGWRARIGRWFHA